jgi:DNA-binding beta-propeller fold protein YncE
MSRLRTRSGIASVVLLGLAVILIAIIPATAHAPAAVYANFESAQTNPIRLSADATRLYAVNTANNSLSVFNVAIPGSPVLIAEIPMGVGPTSVNPRTSDEVWVTNQVSNSVSVASVSKGIVTSTIYTGAGTEPVDVVFAGTNQAYVSLSRSNAIAVYDTTTQALITSLPVFGGSPRALAVSKDGSTVYGAFAISGNGTTIIPTNLAPPQPPPLNKNLPPPPRASLIVAASNPNWSSYITFKMPDNDVVEIAVAPSPTVSGYYSGVGTINLGIAVNPVTGDLFVTNTDALNLTFYVPSLRGHWQNNRITRIQVATGTITPFDLNPGINYTILPNPAALATALAQPAGVVFDPSGNFMYLAAFGTDRVAQVDTNGNVLTFVELAGPGGTGSKADPKNKVGPRGLALNAGAATLYSLNRIDNTISIINTSTMTKSGDIPIGTDTTPLTIKQGRGFLYDAKLSGNGTGACASCHVDGDMDHLAWNLGDRSGNLTTLVQDGQTFTFHPMKGPMTTRTLRGLVNLSPYHWRGDFPTLGTFNSVFDNLMGNSRVSNSDMIIYAAFLNSLLDLPNPNENLDRTLPATINGGNPTAGLNDYLTVHGSGTLNKTCNECHTADPGPGTNRLVSNCCAPQPLKTPDLRNIYQKLLYTRHATESIDGFGMEHDGNISGALDLLDESFFHYTVQEKTDLIAYLLCFDTGTAPAVGFTITLTAANVNNLANQTDWTTLEGQALAGNSDLIARGTIQGQVHGLLYQPSESNYISDAGTIYTHAQLQAFIVAGDTLSFSGVYPGTGTTH